MTRNNHSNLETVEERKRPLRSLRARLLFYVNAVLAVAVLLFLFFDYRQEYHSRLYEKQIALTEEARALLPAVLHFQYHGRKEIQTYLDAVCGSMREEQSPGHHIAVRVKEDFVQALTHHRASPKMLLAMEKAAGVENHQVKLDDKTLVVGSARQEDNIVYVSEYLGDLHQVIVGQILWRLTGIGLMALLAAAVVNAVLLRLVAKPVESLAGTVRQISQGNLGVQTNSQSTAELAYLADAINAMSCFLAEAESERKAQIAKARSIQEHLFPKFTNENELKIVHLYQPATDIAGDFFDVLQMPDGAWLICIADVTGHGVAAAMGAVVLKTLFLGASEKRADPEKILSFINDRFVAVSLPDDFATMFVGRWDPRTACLEYASAGHEPSYLLKPDGALQGLNATGFPLGIQEDVHWESSEIPVAEGDRLFLATDGLVETFGSEETLFGRHNLMRLLRDGHNLSLEAKVHEIDQTLKDYRGEQPSHDDVTLVAIEFTEGAKKSSEYVDRAVTITN